MFGLHSARYCREMVDAIDKDRAAWREWGVRQGFVSPDEPLKPAEPYTPVTREQAREMIAAIDKDRAAWREWGAKQGLFAK